MMLAWFMLLLPLLPYLAIISEPGYGSTLLTNKDSCRPPGQGNLPSGLLSQKEKQIPADSKLMVTSTPVLANIQKVNNQSLSPCQEVPTSTSNPIFSSDNFLAKNIFTIDKSRTRSPLPGPSVTTMDNSDTKSFKSNYFDSDNEHYSDLETENMSLPATEFHIEGRRIVNISYLFRSIQEINKHEPFNCGVSEMQIIGEKMDGLISRLILQCKMCNVIQYVYTEDPQSLNEINLNSAAVLATVTTGCGYSQLVEQHAIMNIPQMSYRQYQNHHDVISQTIYDSMSEAVKEAGEQELQLARDLGEVDDEGNGLISVIVDGAWSKRSYKVNYDALSGVACIIGAKTGKVLYVATKNKYCGICVRAASKNVEPREHLCAKNWSGSSTSMESQLILEGFKESVNMHKLKYIRLIGDGDSSVTKKISVVRPYGSKNIVKKIECTNHLLRNFCGKLRDLSTKRFSSKNKIVNPKLRNLLKSSIERIRIGIKAAINYHRKQDNPIDKQIHNLIQDIRNSPYHVFGKHENCSQYFCKGQKEIETNYIQEMEDCGLMGDILLCCNRLVQNSYSLILNMNNNAAETYNSVVAKFTGGKRINFATKSSYNVRCNAAAISFNKSEEYIPVIIKRLGKLRTGQHTQKYVDKIKQIRLKRHSKQTLGGKIKKSRLNKPADKDYGKIEDEDQQVNVLDFQIRKKAFLASLTKTQEEIVNIEQMTKGQAGNELWNTLRGNMLTASNFGAVCKQRKTTNPAKLTKRILCSDFVHSKAIEWGKDHEETAKIQFEQKYAKKIYDNGLFIYGKLPYLGASPDGVINSEEIIEIKCPYSSAHLTPEEGILQKKIKYMYEENGKFRLKKNNNYYYQVQGQLAITGAKYCYFIVWTPLGLLFDKIERDTNFWITVEEKLSNFYLDNLLPHIIKQN